MFHIFYVLITLHSSLLASEVAGSSSPAVTGHTWGPNYTTSNAAEDALLHVHGLTWKNRSINMEPCTPQGEITERKWNEICQKAFGKSENSEGIIYYHALRFVWAEMFRHQRESFDLAK